MDVWCKAFCCRYIYFRTVFPECIITRHFHSKLTNFPGRRHSSFPKLFSGTHPPWRLRRLDRILNTPLSGIATCVVISKWPRIIDADSAYISIGNSKYHNGHNGPNGATAKAPTALAALHKGPAYCNGLNTEGCHSRQIR